MLLIQKARYAPGQMVVHRDHGFLGIVYDIDPIFEPDGFNATNDREADRPWYHLLVDGEGATAYIAEENLEAVDYDEDFQHPLFASLFEASDTAGATVRYIVN